MTETTGRTPRDLAVEVEGLLRVDWASVWPGLPEPGTPEFRRLCERYGWEPETPFHERGSMDVHTRTGAKLAISMESSWGQVRSLDHYAWHVKAGDASENGAVLARAAETWPVYLKAVEEVLGAPTWTGPWNAEDFPEPLHPAYWPDKAFRLESRRPYEFAYWQPSREVPGRPYITLSQSVSFPTWTATAPGGSRLYLELWAPTEFLAAR
ncbi:hypothetical protein [Streptomyces sp. MUM 203J]|uniref:hypothetical protein n=1 Tax=Streptomyces sp. MUM 203J TaxID=2791990 RepID=UPI001F04BB12|nr:hypothetical protein [Streptomyces sp. MUM 203J]